MTEKELLIDKLSDSMDPSNAREFVERVIREATLPLGGEGRALIEQWRERAITLRHDINVMRDDIVKARMLTECADELEALLTISGAAHQEAEQNDLNTRTDAPTIRSEELLRRTLSMLCNYVWTKQLRPGEHMWSIPVDKERDFDCILSDAIDELIARRAVLSLMSDK